ncbi:polysaccharide biosynthesis protein [Paenibacillus sp. FSL R7-269]|uniref:flippase n=1 Tax=Paenibacillus sp. FSL R7-269 TaxID=1226755 RepID=UPI0003E26620|nr:flippase [Paenibacillus sp. FSL R7-269]ETT45156.1 polysaccharide biosynthesis protein [Paenibacillus sp. FSL R7-269]
MNIQKIKKIKKNILNNEVALKTIKNSGWLVSDRIFFMIIGVFVTALSTRYFGPEIYGQYSYATSFVALFTAFSTLGLETLTVRAIINKEDDEGTILCTSLILRISGGLILTVFASLLIRILEPNHNNIHIIVLIMSFTMLFKSLEVIEYWVQAYQKSKISSVIRMGTYVISALLKILVIILKGNIIHFSLVYMFDAIIIGFALILAYFNKRENKNKWKFNLTYSKKIISQSWYIMISGLMITIYMKIDQVMLGSIIENKEELGVYSAAVQISEMWYFIPMAIITSFKPIIMKKKKTNDDTYIESVQFLYTIIAWISISFGVFVLLTSKIIVNILFGAAYFKASDILLTNIWAGIFAMLGSVASVWYVCENYQKYSIVLVFSGLIMNITLNLILIPKMGGNGAAIATLITQFFSNFVVPLFIKDIRLNSIMIIRAFMYPIRKWLLK